MTPSYSFGCAAIHIVTEEFSEPTEQYVESIGVMLMLITVLLVA